MNSDPNQVKNVMGTNNGEARELHRLLVQFMRENQSPGAPDATPVGTAFLAPLKIDPRQAGKTRGARTAAVPAVAKVLPDTGAGYRGRIPGSYRRARDNPGSYLSSSSHTQARSRGSP